MYGRELTVCNTDKQLIFYIKGLLKKNFDINVTEPHIYTKKDMVMRCPRTGKTCRTNKDYYLIYIRTHSLKTFYEAIGFTTRRKQRRLVEAAKK